MVVSVDAASGWSKTYGGTGDENARSLIVTSDGGYALVGITSAGNGDAWLVKTDAFGNMQWNKTYGGTLWDYAYSLVATPDGGYALAGSSGFSIGVLGDFWLVKTDSIGVIPEFSSWLIPSLVLTATAFIVINKKKLLLGRS